MFLIQKKMCFFHFFCYFVFVFSFVFFKLFTFKVLATGAAIGSWWDLQALARIQSDGLVTVYCLEGNLPGVTRERFLEVLKYLKTSKQHPFETPGRRFFNVF